MICFSAMSLRVGDEVRLAAKCLAGAQSECRDATAAQGEKNLQPRRPNPARYCALPSVRNKLAAEKCLRARNVSM